MTKSDHDPNGIPHFPLHAILQSDLTKADFLMEALTRFDNHLFQQDRLGRLPLHVALSKKHDVVPASIMLRLMEMEPRALFVQDPVSQIYPLQMINRHESQWEAHESLAVLYQAFRTDPVAMMTSMTGPSGKPPSPSNDAGCDEPVSFAPVVVK